jgi:hypothetical protein
LQKKWRLNFKRNFKYSKKDYHEIGNNKKIPISFLIFLTRLRKLACIILLIV